MKMQLLINKWLTVSSTIDFATGVEIAVGGGGGGGGGGTYLIVLEAL